MEGGLGEGILQIAKKCHSKPYSILSPLSSSSSCLLGNRLERQFYDRVVQTNRVKAPGMTPLTSVSASNPIMIVSKMENELENRPPTPPWLRPPKSYKAKGRFAEKEKILAAAAATWSVRMAAARPNEVPSSSSMQKQREQQISVSSTPPLVDIKSDTEYAIAAIKRSNSSLGRVSSLDRLAEAAEMLPRTESALEQLARTASGKRESSHQSIYLSISSYLILFLCSCQIC